MANMTKANRKQSRRPWTETSIHLTRVQAVTMTGPGPEFLLIVKGTRRAGPQAAIGKRRQKGSQLPNSASKTRL